jgi:hypothetical protein
MPALARLGLLLLLPLLHGRDFPRLPALQLLLVAASLQLQRQPASWALASAAAKPWHACAHSQ